MNGQNWHQSFLANHDHELTVFGADVAHVGHRFVFLVNRVVLVRSGKIVFELGIVAVVVEVLEELIVLVVPVRGVATRYHWFRWNHAVWK